MEICDEQQPVRRRRGGEENKQTPGENMDVEAGALGWARSGTVGTTQHRGRNEGDTCHDQPQKTKNLKIDKNQRSLCIGGVDRELRVPLLTKNVTPYLENPRDATHLQNRYPQH